MKNKFAPTTILAFQAAIAIILCFIIGNYFQLEKSYWAVLTALLLISQTWGESLKKALERISMTIIGGFIGTLVFFAIQPQPMLLFPIMMLTVACMVFVIGHSFRASAFFVTMFVVFLFGMIGQWNFHLLEIRIYETLLGATIAVLTSLIFLPNHAKSDFISQAKDYLQQSKDIIDTSLEIATHKQNETLIPRLRDQLFKSLTQLSDTFTTSSYEMLVTFVSQKKAKELLNLYSVLIHYVTSLLESSPYSHYELLSDSSKHQFEKIHQRFLDNISVIIENFQKKGNHHPVISLKQDLDSLADSCLLTLKDHTDASACALHMISFIYYLQKINEILLELDRL